MAQKELCDFPCFPLKKGRHTYLWERGTLRKGWAKEGQGIAKKPFIEAGLLLDVLSKHADLVRDFKTYEFFSAQGAADPRGLLVALDMVEDLLELSPYVSCTASPSEIHCSDF